MFQFADGDEPMLSGTGEVSKDCSADELANWAEVLDTWQVNEQRPKLLIKLTKLGIPEALRAQVWQRLSNCDNSQEMMDKYRMLITKVYRIMNFVKQKLEFITYSMFHFSLPLGEQLRKRYFERHKQNIPSSRLLQRNRRFRSGFALQNK